MSESESLRLSFSGRLLYNLGMSENFAIKTEGLTKSFKDLVVLKGIASLLISLETTREDK